MNRAQRFWDRHADAYARRAVPDEEAYRRKLEITRRYLRPDMRVLEIGCGTGSTALLHAPHVAHIRAIDVSPRMIEIARRKADRQAVGNVDFEVATLDRLDAPAESVDAVLALNVLHLLDDWRGDIGRIHRLLKPGGILVSSTFCLADMSILLRALAPLGRVIGLLPPFRIFSAEELLRAFVDAGFTITQQWNPGRNKAIFVVAAKGA